MLKKLLLTVSCLVFSISALADEGMWIYNNLPLKTLKEKYQFEPSAEWLDHLMHSSVRFSSGGSGSFISKDGLVLTNHHVGADTLAKISSQENDYLTTGFYADTLEKEVKAPDLELNQLVNIEDVTTRVNSAVTPNMSPADASKARRAEISKIEKESLDATGLKSSVVTLYQGGQYHLYRYKRYSDVRLVFAPEKSAAFFGGDPDNFEFPRYDLDMCIFRVYENDKPATIKDFLKWSDKGTQEGDLVFVSGHPGSTRRLLTMAALTELRRFRAPYVLSYLRRLENVLQQFGNEGPEQRRRAEDELFSIQNSRKAYEGKLKGLQNDVFLSKKQAAENRLRQFVSDKPELKEVAVAWDNISKAEAAASKTYIERSLFEAGQAFNSHLFSIARTLVRIADEDKKPNAERLTEYQDANRESLLIELFSEAPIYKDFEQVKFASSLSYLLEQLEKNPKYRPLITQILQGKTPGARAAEIINGTQLSDVSLRRYLAANGKSAIDESLDPMIQLAKLVDPAARKLRKNFEENVDETLKQSYALIAKAMFTQDGTSTYPDATFSLRLSFGTISGYKEDDGTTVPPYTDIAGAFKHEAKHQSVEPWKLPESWHKAAETSTLDQTAKLNFVATADIIGGNSGSPVVNRNGELVGLIFDSNIQSLAGDYGYSDVQGRSVSVDSRGMLEALSSIYKATALVEQLKAKAEK